MPQPKGKDFKLGHYPAGAEQPELQPQSPNRSREDGDLRGLLLFEGEG
jgi:hypothetical protein